MPDAQPRPRLFAPAQLSAMFQQIDGASTEVDAQQPAKAALGENQFLHVLVIPRRGETFCLAYEDIELGLQKVQEWHSKNSRKEFLCEVYAFLGERVNIQPVKQVFTLQLSGKDYSVTEA
jgi:hypothetical protein